MTKCIYVMRAGDGPVKIGVAADVSKRLTGISSGQPYALTLISATEPRGDARKIEQAAHRLLRDRRIRNEWFDVTPDEALTALAKAIAIVEAAGPPDAPRERPVTPAQYIREHVFGLATQTEFAALLGVEQATVSRYENGWSLSGQTMYRIRELALSRGLKWDSNWLFEVPTNSDAPKS